MKERSKIFPTGDELITIAGGIIIKLIIKDNIRKLLKISTTSIFTVMFSDAQQETTELKISKGILANSGEWDKKIITSFAHELEETCPTEWHDWQHWISDMMESRTRMLAKGRHHRFVSLITFYRLFQFIWHIGIDKVFVLAIRRATR